MTSLKRITLGILCGFSIASNTHAFNGIASQETILPAPGYGELNFEAPSAGSYKLPVLGYAKNASVINTSNDTVSYHELFRGKYTLLNFMYTRCDDLNGCPLTHVVFSRIKDLAKKDPIIAKNLQMLSMSFDPTYDTPERLKELESGSHDQHMSMDHDNHHNHDEHHMHQQAESVAIDWKYLTTHSEDELKPILDNYGQSVMPRLDNDSQESGNFSHILRVFLIDPELKIRNIYSVSFLHPDIIINDLKTVMMEYGVNENTTENEHLHNIRIGAGDSKNGYETKDYVTNSLSIENRKGKETDLLRFSNSPPLGLPAVPVPEDNPITQEKVKLGKKLFFDRRLSLNNTISCAICHIPEQGFTNHEIHTAVGFEGRSVKRNAPTIYNTAYYTKLFHDGRENTLEHQAWQPLLARNEMANPSFGSVIEKIRNLDDYMGLFEAAFDGDQASFENIPKAIASYERTLNSANSPFDRWYYGKEETAISASAKRGFNLFAGKAMCTSCHTVTDEYALFTDNNLHNTGIGWTRAMKKEPEKQRIQVAPGRFLNIKNSIIQSVANRPEGDLGRYEVTQDPDDRWKYRTPSLRNIALTAPYMHDGSMGSLNEVVAFYNQGGFPNETQSPLIMPLNLSQTEMDDLVEFLMTLNGDNVSSIISDAFSTPIGDTTH